MAALSAGTVAPDVPLRDMEGKAFSLEHALKKGPVVLAFFKISCPVCQYTFPFLERLYKAHKDHATILGVSQNSKADTARFLREYGITFRTLLDDPDTYAVSNAYGLTNVPTIFLVTPGGEIEVSSVGWSRRDLEEMNRRLAETSSAKPSSLFHRGEDVIDSKAG